MERPNPYGDGHTAALATGTIFCSNLFNVHGTTNGKQGTTATPSPLSGWSPPPG